MACRAGTLDAEKRAALVFAWSSFAIGVVVHAALAAAASATKRSAAHAPSPGMRGA